MSTGGGSGSDGSNDMQVSGAEAAYSTEKGISTYADTKTSGVADTSTVGSAAPEPHSDTEIEKGYTDDGQKLSNVNGVYMTKSEMYNKGIVEIDPNTGQDVQGRNTINPETGQLEKADLSFAEHFANSPVKFSPTLSFLYASGKNIGDYFKNKGFKGYNEAGLRDVSNFTNDRQSGLLSIDRETDRQIMQDLAPEAPYIVSGIQRPSNSPASNWYQSLGKTNTSGFQFSFANELSAAKAKQKTILGNPSSIGQLAVNQSPFYNWLKTKSLDKGIL